MIDAREIKVKGFEMVEREAKLFKGGSSCTIYAPKKWKGKTVLLITLEK